MGAGENKIMANSALMLSLSWGKALAELGNYQCLISSLYLTSRTSDLKYSYLMGERQKELNY